MSKKLKENFLLIGLIIFCIGLFFVLAKINLFRYNNFDFGKFDLGNMTQMVWYTLQGKPLYLTGYFGVNFPRWAMSHVDPILLLFVPVFAVVQHPLTLVFSQIILILSSSVILYKIAFLEHKSKLVGFLVGLSFLFYPAVGFVTAWTGFHGVSAAIPFFLLAFYMFEKMHKTGDYSKKSKILFWMFLVITMSGKEQLPLYVVMYGIFILFFRTSEPVSFPTRSEFKVWISSVLKIQSVKIGLSMIAVGLIWFYVAFFVIIPNYAPLRQAGFNEFARSLGINPGSVRDVDSENYFISRYDAFGDSYTSVLVGMIKNPDDLARIIFGGDKPENMVQTFEPVGYLPFLSPQVFMIAFPDLLINYSTSAGGIGTSEIINHRISMIIPVLFLSSIYSLGLLASLLSRLPKVKKEYALIVLSGAFLYMNIQTTYKFNNPVYQWLTQALQKRLAILPVFAKEDLDGIWHRDDIEVGERFRLSKLETKDRECAQKIVDKIPDDVVVSGPDYLGAHLSMRETYAIFPVLYDSADYVIVDVFSQKILRILDLDVTLVRDVVADVIKLDDYELKMGCGNLFVFEKIGQHNKEQKLPLQEKFEYDEKIDLEIFLSLTIVDYEMPKELTRGQVHEAQFVYVKREEESLDNYVLFLSFINNETGDLYQVANLPSFSLNQPRNWREDVYYIEDLDLALPEFLDAGNYKLFIGMSNEIRTRSIYLGDVKVN